MPTVRLIDEDKEMIGICSREDAMKAAEEAGLDLVRRVTRIGLATARVLTCAHAHAWRR